MEQESEESGDSFNDGAEFVREQKMKNSDFKDLLFGEKKKRAGGANEDEEDGDIPKLNFLTRQKYSERFYTLLETRKGLPTW